jgi:hypothetical protein
MRYFALLIILMVSQICTSGTLGPISRIRLASYKTGSRAPRQHAIYPRCSSTCTESQSAGLSEDTDVLSRCHSPQSECDGQCPNRAMKDVKTLRSLGIRDPCSGKVRVLATTMRGHEQPLISGRYQGKRATCTAKQLRLRGGFGPRPVYPCNYTVCEQERLAAGGEQGRFSLNFRQRALVLRLTEKANLCSISP